MANPIRIAVIDDHPLYRAGLERCFNISPDFEIVATGDTATAAWRIAVCLLPDILLLDIGIPGNGLLALQSIHRATPDVRVVMLTASDELEQVDESLESGARGYILKGIDSTDLVAAMRSIRAGERYVTPSLLVRQCGGAGAEKQAEPTTRPHAELSHWERRILALAAEGLTNKEISDNTKLPIGRIKHELTRSFKKLSVKNRLAATVAYKWARH